MTIDVNEHSIVEQRHGFKCEDCDEERAYPSIYEEFNCNPETDDEDENEDSESMEADYSGHHPVSYVTDYNIEEKEDKDSDHSEVFDDET